MTLTDLSPPAEDEFAPFYRGYVSLVAGTDAHDRLREQPALLRRMVEGLSDEDGLRRYAPDKWSVKEVVGHLCDAERIFSYRLLRVGRGDATPLAGFDEVAYVIAASFDEKPVLALVEELEILRAATLRLVEGLGPDAWTRRGVANQAPISARALVYIIVGHFQHHLEILRDRYRLGPGSPT
jgi:hypothetical protein